MEEKSEPGVGEVVRIRDIELESAVEGAKRVGGRTKGAVVRVGFGVN